MSTTVEKFLSIINSSKPTIVYFYAKWCGPCKIANQFLNEIKKIYDVKMNVLKDKINILEIDVDEDTLLATTYNVKSIPTIYVFMNGAIIWYCVGLSNINMLNDVLKNNIITQ